MRNVEVTAYTLDELNENAFERAYMSWYESYDYDYAFDNEKTLNKFERIFDIDVYGWEYDANYYNYNFKVGYDESREELKGVRLATYLYNNYWEYITKGKYYSTKGEWINGKHHYKYRYSNVIIETNNCPLTGYYIDNEILQPIFDFMNKPENITFEELIDRCLDLFFKCCKDDCFHSSSEEAFREMNEDAEYYEDGRVFCD